MKPEKILEVIGLYRDMLEHNKQFFHHNDSIPPATALAHCREMLNKMEEFVKEGHTGKAFRWLGFIQGVLWTYRMYSLDELKDHNRPATPKETPIYTGLPVDAMAFAEQYSIIFDDQVQRATVPGMDTEKYLAALAEQQSQSFANNVRAEIARRAQPEVSEAVKHVRATESPPGDCGVGCGCGFCN